MDRFSFCFLTVLSVAGGLEVTDAARIVGSKSSGLIVGGRDARKGEYPSQAVLYLRSRGEMWCGGTILNERYILTAAHCLKSSASNYYVAVGKHKRSSDEDTTQYRDVKRVLMHEKYRKRNKKNDIGLVELDSPIVYNKDVQPITLAGKKMEPEGRCYITGFGLTTQFPFYIPAYTLQELRTSLMDNDACREYLSQFDIEDRVTEKIICTKDTDEGACSGDSGGPLGCFDAEGNYTQYGVLAWGSTSCALGFNVYTKVWKYQKWLDANMV